ncbi:MAG: hypothetical protein RLZZ175_3163 [Bacteroidota bacterium]|jgi:6-phosphogluconate dehydrogenase
MNTLIIKGDGLKPIELTCFDYEVNNNQGIVRTENIFDLFFYWIKNYSESYYFDIELKIAQELQNRNAVKNIFETIEKLSVCSQKGHHIVINWYCNQSDLELKETISNIENILKISINKIDFQYENNTFK